MRCHTLKSITDQKETLALGTEVKPIISETGLSTFQLEEEVLVTQAPSDKVMPDFIITDAYPDQTPDQIMTRWYQTAVSSTLTDTTAAGLIELARPSIILTQPAVKGAMLSYRYLQFAAIEYKVQFSTTPMVYGWACLSTKGSYFIYSTGSTDIQTYQLLSQDDAVIVDFSVQEEINLTAEWRSPAQMYDLETGGDIDSIHQLYLGWYANPVKKFNAAAPGSVTFQVFCRFVRPRLLGHVYNTGLSERGFERAESQMQAMVGGIAGGVGMAGLAWAGEKASTFLGNTAYKYAEKTASTYVEESLNGLLDETEEASPEADPDLRPSVYGSMTKSRPRYILGTGALGSREKKNGVKSYIMMPTFVNLWTLSNTVGQFSTINYYQPAQT
jgi:hypothetical protein